MDSDSSIVPPGEPLRQALRWLAGEQAFAPGSDRRRLIEQACVRFDLTPLEADFLYRQLGGEETTAPGPGP